MGIAFDSVGDKAGLTAGLYFFAIWFIYLVMKPIYLFPLGMPQISDFILVIGIIPALIFMVLRPIQNISFVVLTGGLFAAFTVMVNLANYVFYPDKMFILSSLYYPYNFLIFTFIIYLFKLNNVLMVRVCVAGIFIGLAIQVLSLQFFPDINGGGRRLTGGFKNPNQLAYWSLLSVCMLVFLRRRESFGKVELSAIVLGAYLQTLALSKAGLIMYAVFLFVLVFTPQISRLSKIFVIFVALICSCIFLFQGEGASYNHLDTGARVKNRLATLGYEHDDSFEGRGYNRLAEHPEYMIVGAGEGGFERFRTAHSPAELHSGLATILFSYGVLGLLLFGSFIFLIFYKQPLYCTAILFIILIYGATSQTIRFTHTWVFLGVAYGSYIVRREENFLAVAAHAKDPLIQQA